ncbi:MULTISPECIES: hypothetical protein [Streptococcus]|uniref:hypothetical protein n=1 Tax=Streptococcus TaxID=1301 RepID=UPI0007E3BE82|nr:MULTISPECIES: hypothetical protein [Streptococcus]MBK5069819.1 hypothetical protein [Streptococcus sp. 21.1]MBS6319651.1 hypothetical protein [Streptococcus salivarius]OHQ22005.1 hypothetical protein HMPREF2637_06340 [Streptococcus sp. HMSC065H07]QQB69678.1 hypothetical protein I6I02_08405 [Streptococcus salivarius]
MKNNQKQSPIYKFFRSFKNVFDSFWRFMIKPNKNNQISWWKFVVLIFVMLTIFARIIGILTGLSGARHGEESSLISVNDEYLVGSENSTTARSSSSGLISSSSSSSSSTSSSSSSSIMSSSSSLNDITELSADEFTSSFDMGQLETNKKYKITASLVSKDNWGMNGDRTYYNIFISGADPDGKVGDFQLRTTKSVGESLKNADSATLVLREGTDSFVYVVSVVAQ